MLLVSKGGGDEKHSATVDITEDSKSIDDQYGNKFSDIKPTSAADTAYVDDEPETEYKMETIDVGTPPITSTTEAAEAEAAAEQEAADAVSTAAGGFGLGKIALYGGLAFLIYKLVFKK